MTTTPEPRGKLGAMATQQVATAIRSRAVVNGPEDDVLVWDAVGWRAAEDDVRRLCQRIFTDLLEPDAVKAARPVVCPLHDYVEDRPVGQRFPLWCKGLA